MNRRNRILIALALVAALALALSVAAASTTPAAKPTGPAGKTSATHAASVKVDLNSATRAQLAKVPGIGEPVADRIIAARPFTSKAQLLSRKLVTRAAYGRIAPHVIVRQPLASK